jgi:hypothetical protein
MSATPQEELRQQLADTLFGHDGVRLGDPANTVVLLDKLVAVGKAHTAQAVTAALEEFRVFCYEKHAFEAFDTPASNRQGWLDTKLREFVALKGQQK